MPKQIHKIDQFHGGLNTNSDPRDIAENELSSATDIMVDELGMIRTLGGTVNHDSFTSTSARPFTGAITSGYGLFYWSSDSKGANVLSTDYSGTHTAADSSTIMTDIAASFPVDALIGATINNTTDGSSGVITDNTATTVTVASLSGGSDNSWDDAANDAYTITNFPKTGDNYLAFSDSDTTGTVSVYSFASDSWDEVITGMTNQSGGTRKDVFYAADGELRICDAEFGNTNLSQWYGYIDRVYFKSVTDTQIVDQWYQTAQSISAPDDTSEFDNIQYTSVTYTSTGDNYTNAADSATADEITEDALYDGGVLNMVGGIEVTVRLTTTTYTDIPDFDDFRASFTITTGSANLDTNTFLGTVGISHKTDDKSEMATAASNTTTDFTYTFTFGDTFVGGSSIGTDFANGVTTYGIRTTLTDSTLGAKIASVALTNVKVTEAVVNSANTQSKLTTGNVFMQILQKTPSDTTNMIPRGWGKEWEYGISFMYDEKQESLIRTLFDSGNSNKTELDNTDGEAKCPELKLYVDANDSSFNRRITGAVWYIREASGGETANEWTAQVEFDFVKGVSRVLSSGKETDCLFNTHATGGQYEFTVDNDHLLSPNLVDTYTSRTGILRDENSIKARYKTAVMVGRRMYVGNVEITKEDGTKEVRGDAMLKSPVNMFDTFPSKSVVEAAINDGESIVALEEFADRILQFKEQSLYIINVSQDIEFLEDVYKFKGVSQPSAVCKTDYGIAWANKFGCYLYDGKQVINLLEKGGRQIIKDHGSGSWETFAANSPMIGFIPHKRQLLLVDDNTQTGTGNIMLYDMVTQSWVEGIDATLVSEKLTNFVNDSDGSLVWAALSNGATMRKWDDDSATTNGLIIQTKDIDFGFPGVRKKVHKVYLTYQGNSTHVQVQYGVDGLVPASNFYAITSGTDGSSTGGSAAAKCIAYDAGTNDWLKAELKPSASINNISSFRLKISGDGSNAISSDFKINDISFVYRLKPVK